MANRYTVDEGKGPGKWDWIMAFANSTHKNSVSVEFHVKPPVPADTIPVIEVLLSDLSHEDGSGNSWCFKGYGHWLTEAKLRRVQGWYRTDSRRGWIEFTD